MDVREGFDERAAALRTATVTGVSIGQRNEAHRADDWAHTTEIGKAVVLITFIARKGLF